jgi:hypothetical protein
MQSLRRSIPLFAAILAVGAFGAQSALGATTSARGVVIASRHGTVLVAGTRGAVRALHGTARPGSRIVVRGTRFRVVGRAHRIELEGSVTAVGNGTATLLVAGQPLTIRLPAGVKVPAAAIGTRIEIEIELGEDNDANDDNVGRADNSGPGRDADRGDDHHGGGHDRGGSGRGGDDG